MSNSFTFLVDVEVDRDSGKFVSRDELGEAIADSLEEAQPSLSGLGSEANSEYNVASIGVQEILKKDMKKVWAQYDQVVAEQTAPVEQVREDLKKANIELRKLKEQLAAKDKKIANLEKVREQNSSRVYMETGFYPNKVTEYLPDSGYDRIFFQHGEDEHDRFAVVLQGDRLSIRSEGFVVGGMVVLPRSANEIEIALLEGKN